jgi:hypothetical protein
MAGVNLPNGLGLLVADIDNPNRDFVALLVMVRLRAFKE